MLLLTWATVSWRTGRCLQPVFVFGLTLSRRKGQWSALCQFLDSQRLGFEDGIGRGKQFLSYFQVQRDEKGGKGSRSHGCLSLREQLDCPC